MSAAALFRPTFTDLRSEVERLVAQDAPESSIAALIDQFIAAGGEAGAPLVEYDGTVTWLYRDARAEHVAVVGDILGFDAQATRMTRLEGCDLFYLTAQLPLDAQVAYAFAVDNPPPETDDAQGWGAWLERCRPDPLNPRRMVETRPLRAVSLLSMPGARSAIEPDHQHAVGAAHVVGRALGIWRRVWVSLPSSYDPRTRRYPAIYFLDGEAYLLAAGAPQIAEALVEQGEIAPAILVFVEGRAADGSQEAQLTRFLAEELVPWVEGRFACLAGPEGRVIAGSSSGAALALRAALERPDLFGGALAQSPAPELEPDSVERALAGLGQAHPTPRCYVDVGRYEPQASVEYAHALCNALIAAGAALSYQEFGGDHSFAGWRTTLPDALRFFLGAAPINEL